MRPLQSENKHRHSHRKSRLGCLQCKRRKIKCDETRPACLNCIRREVSCAYTPPARAGDEPSQACMCKCSGCRPGAESPRVCEAASSTSVPDPPEASQSPADNHSDSGLTLSGLPRIIAEQSVKLDSMSHRLTSMESTVARLAQTVSTPPALSYADMDLMHHFYTSTLPSIGDGGSGPKSWSTCLPSLSSRHPHLYHLMLAFAALHKARLYSHQRAEFLLQAERHHVVGVQGSTASLESIDDGNYEVVHISAILIGLINLAMGPRPGEYIAISDQTGPNFLGLLRGLRSIRNLRRRNTAPDALPVGSSAPVAAQQPPVESPFAKNSKSHLRHLYARSQKIPDTRQRRAYIDALDDLEKFYILIDGPVEGAGESSLPGDEHQVSAFGWLYRLEDDFLQRLQSKESLAVVIFAYFVVVLKEREVAWLTDGWAEHIMPYICREVDPDVRQLVQWPLLRLYGLTQGSSWSDNRIDSATI